jgi:hypothetical protein
MPTVQKEVSDRSGFGKIIKWLFIAFNILMPIWVISGMFSVGHVSEIAINDAERAGAAIGATLGIGMLLILWAIGDLILGLFVLFTKRKKLITIEE